MRPKAWQCKQPSYEAKQEVKGSKATNDYKNDEVGTFRKNPPAPELKKPDVMKEIEKPIQFRREAYLEVTFRGRKILALLDSGCEHSVIGKNLIPMKMLEKTNRQLCAVNGSPLPLLGETVIEFEVSGFRTGAHVLVTNAVTSLILGIDWLQEK